MVNKSSFPVLSLTRNSVLSSTDLDSVNSNSIVKFQALTRGALTRKKIRANRPAALMTPYVSVNQRSANSASNEISPVLVSAWQEITGKNNTPTSRDLLKFRLTSNNQELNFALRVAHGSDAEAVVSVLEELYQNPSLKPLLSKTFFNGATIAHAMASMGNVEGLKWLQGKEDISNLLFFKAKVAPNLPIKKDIFNLAAEFGNTSVLDWICSDSELKNKLLLQDSSRFQISARRHGQQYSTRINWHENHFYDAVSSGNKEVTSWFLNKMQQDKDLRSLLDRQVVAGRTPLDILSNVQNNNHPDSNFSLPAEVEGNISSVLSFLNKQADNIKKEFIFEDRKTESLQKLSTFSEACRNLTSNLSRIPTDADENNLAEIKDSIVQSVKTVQQEIEKQSEFVNKLVFSNSSEMVDRLFSIVDSKAKTIQDDLNRLSQEKTEFNNKVYQLMSARAESPVDFQTSAPETSEEYSYIKTGFLNYVNFIDSFAQDSQTNGWSEFLIQDMGEDINYDDFIAQIKIDIQSISSFGTDAIQDVLQTILKIDAAFDKFQEINHNNRIVTKTRQIRRSNPFEPLNGLRSEIATLEENYNQNSLNSLKSKIFLLQKNALGESEKQKVLFVERKETIGHLRNDLENIGKEILNSKQKISDLKESIQKEITPHDIAFMRDSLTKIQGLLSQKYKLTQSQAQMLRKQCQLQANLDDLSGKMRGARMFTRIHEVKIPAALNRLSADLQQIERNYSIQSLVVPIQAALDNHSQAMNFVESEPLQQVFNAYGNGDLQTVAMLLQQQPDLINQHDGDGYTLLFQAVTDGEVEFVNMLLQHSNPAPQLEVEASDGLTYDVFSSLWEATNESPEYFSTFETIQNMLIEYSKTTNQDSLIQVASERYDTIRTA